MQKIQLIITGVNGKENVDENVDENAAELQRLTFRQEDTQFSLFNDKIQDSHDNTKDKSEEPVKLPSVQQKTNNSQSWKSSKKGKDLPPNQQLIKPQEIAAVGSVDPAGPALASIGEGRSRTLAKLSSHNRKVVSMLNDQMKGRCILANEALDRVQKQVISRLSKAQKPVKQSLEELRDIKRSLAEVADDTNDVYGRYGGKTGHVAKVMTKVKNAKLTAQEVREKRYNAVQVVLERGLTSGRLTDGQELVQRVRNIFEEPFPEIKLRPKTVKTRKGNFLPSLKIGLQTLHQTDKGYGNFHIATTTAFVGNQPN